LNFDFTDDQQAIKRTAKELLAKRFTLEKLRELCESESYDDAIWNEVVELGWTGIFIDEEHGGQGLGTVELVILQEELGYSLAPLPFLSNAAAGLVLQHAGNDEQKGRWLPGIASGETRATLAASEDALVPDGDTAELFVVLDDNGGASVVERSAAEVEPVRTIDAARRYAQVRASGGEALEGDVAAGLDRVHAAIAAELVGVAQRAMEMAVEYAKDRKQFDRPIGAYQAVAHRCAQMLLETESARSHSYYAAWTAESEPETLPLAAAMARAYAGDAGWRVTASALQVHGGIGFTWEHDLHWFLKRARANRNLYASGRVLRDRVAELAGLTRDAAAV